MINCSTAGATIYYTVDGTDPSDTNGTNYATGIAVNDDMTIKAIAYRSGMEDSAIAVAVYDIDITLTKVPTPDFYRYGVSLPSGIFTSPLADVEPYCVLGNPSFVYTTDGTDPSHTPTVNGTVWTGGYFPTMSKKTTLKLMAYRTGMVDSNIAEVFYDVFSPAVNVGNSSSAHSALCLDSADKHHLVYWSNTPPAESDKLMYTTDAGGTWLSTPEVVFTLGTGIDMNWLWMAIGVTSNGDVHVVAMRQIGGLRHFVRSHTDGTWSLPAVVDSTEGTSFVGQYVSMDVDADDDIEIVYYDATNTALKAATFQGVSWSPSTITGTDLVGEYCSIATDSTSELHISCYDATNHDAIYTTTIGYFWGAIDDSGDVGKWSSIAVDGNDKVHISYYDETNSALKYATNAPSGTWSVETVDSSDPADPTGLFTSIAVTSDGIPCITYYCGPGPLYYNLWYAVKPSTTWFKKEMAPGILNYARVVVDGSGYASIVYPGRFLKDGP